MPTVCLAAALLAPAEPSLLAAESYAVVVAQDVPVDDLTLDELRRIFLFKRGFWKPGRPIRLVLPATGSATRTFLLAQVYQRTEGELRRIILESVYTGETDQPPKVAASEEESLKLLEALPGSVALLPAETTLPSGLKAVRIDGKRSSEPGYRLSR